jgi:hypothetical protein
MTAIRDPVADAAAWLEGFAAGSAKQSNWLAARGAEAAQTAAALRGNIPSPAPGPEPAPRPEPTPPAVDPRPRPGDKWWLIPGGNRSGKPWNRGVNSTGWNAASCADYERKVGKLDVFCAANHHGAVIFGKDWAEFHAQASFNNSSTFGALLRCKVKDKTIHLLNFYTHPVGVPLQEIADGKHDAEYIQFGQNLRVSVDKAGLSDWQLALRTNKEGNQDEYLTAQAQAHLYGLGVGRAIKGIRKGYGTTSRGRLRFSFSPARGLLVGPLSAFCSFDDDGSCLYDTMSCSTHPASQLNKLLGKGRDAQKAGVRDWLAGDYKDGYSYLNKNPDYSILALARKYRLPISLDEWSPRFETAPHDLHCAIADAAFEAIYEFLAEHAAEVAWDCVFHSNVLTESDSVCPGWAAASRTYKRLWSS